MATPVVMPKLGMTMTEGRVVDWPLALGERIEKGQTVVVIESEKTEAEVEATASGFFRHVYVEPDETVPCGTLLGAITETADEPFDVDAFRAEHDHPETPTPGPSAPVSAGSATPSAPLAASPAPSRASVTPAARALARKLGIDASSVPGSGPGGRVLREDVEAWAARRETLVPVADGVALEVPEEGEGPLVLLIPGFGSDVSMFARQVPALRDSHRVRGLNPRGVGLSDAPEDSSGYDPAGAGADAATLCDSPSHVIGASLGAAAAIELALAHPERVRSLVLLTPFVQASPRLLAVIDAWCRLRTVLDLESLAAALLPWFFSNAALADGRARDRTRRGLAEIAGRVSARTLERQAEGLRAWSARGVSLASIAAPTLIVAAGEDLLTPDAAAVAQAIPEAQLVVVEGAGHAVGLEAPDAVNGHVLDHLSSV